MVDVVVFRCADTWYCREASEKIARFRGDCWKVVPAKSLRAGDKVALGVIHPDTNIEGVLYSAVAILKVEGVKLP